MRAKGTRLWWRKPRYDGAGKVSHPGVWLILDGGRSISTGTADRKEAERALAQHINQSWRPSPQDSAANVKIADVLTYYARERARSWADPKRAAVQLRELNEWWGSRKLSDVTAATCRQFTAIIGGSLAESDGLRRVRKVIRRMLGVVRL